MALLFSTGLIDSVMDIGWDTVFAAPVMELRDGTPPTSADNPESGNLLTVVTLPATDYFTAAAIGVKSKNGSWSGSVSSGGTPTWFRIKDGADAGGLSGSEVRIQGTVGAVGSDADLTLDSLPLVASDSIDISTFVFTYGQGVIDVNGGGTLA